MVHEALPVGIIYWFVDEASSYPRSRMGLVSCRHWVNARVLRGQQNGKVCWDD